MESVSFLSLMDSIIRVRFIKFALVGFSGTIVNLVMLFINQEFLLRDIYPQDFRLKLSLSGAILIATINNYIWNRMWTWSDRKNKKWYGFFIQMGQYFVACGLAIILQFLITVIFARMMNYLLANTLAILLSAIFVYILNNIWTFVKK